MKRVVIDTDPGTDDALALIMAVNSPDLDVQGLATVGGNAALRHTTSNALRLMEYLGHAHMPVARGSARPLRGSFRYAYHFHGPGGLTVRLPKPQGSPEPLRAPDYIISLAYSFLRELVLIALGPLTNIARALIREPQALKWVKEIVVMGGAIRVPGNVTLYAEFNIYNDPQAASVVFSSGVPVTLVGLDVCNQVYLTREDLPSLPGSSRGGRLAQRIVSNWFRLHPQRERYLLCDPLAIAATMRPDILTTERAAVRVEAEAQQTLGQTTAEGSGNVKVATAVDVDAFLDLFRELL